MAGFSGSMRQAERRLALRGSIEYLTGSRYGLTAADFVSVRISEGVDSGILPGAVISAGCTVVMDNSAGQWLAGGEKRGYADIAGAQLTLEIGVFAEGEWLYAPMGVYICDEVVSEVNSAVIQLECHDTIYSRTAPLFEDNLVYPCTAAEIFTEAARQAGYDYQGPLPDSGMIVDSAPDWGGSATIRQVMGYVAALMGSCVLADRWGYLDMRPLAGERTPFVIYPDEYMERTFQEGHFGPVSALRITTVNGRDSSGGERTELRTGNEDGARCELSISGNPLFVTGGGHLDALAEGMLANIAGLEYSGCTFVWRGDPDLSPGRYLRIVGVDGGDTYCTISRQTLTFDMGFSAECVCGVPDVSAEGAVALGAAMYRGGSMDLISSGRIIANDMNVRALTAGSVAADTAAAGNVTARQITADVLCAGSLALTEVAAENMRACGRMEAADIHAGSVAADKLTAKRAETEMIGADDVRTARLEADAASIGSGFLDSAQIGSGSITDARAVRLSAGEIAAESMIITGADGRRYRIAPDTEGLSVTEAEDAGAERVVGADVVTAGSVEARNAQINRLTAGEVEAQQGNIAVIAVNGIESGGALNIAAESGVSVTGGMIADSFAAPDVAPAYAGPAVIEVRPGMSGQGAAGTLAEACTLLSGRRVDGDVVINLPSDVAESGTVALSGVYGAGTVRIMGAEPGEGESRYTVAGIEMKNCGLQVTVSGIDVLAQQDALTVQGCTSVYVYDCSLESSGDCGAVIGRGSDCEIRNCMLRGNRAAHVRMARAVLTGNRGNGGIYAEYAFVACEGTVPEGGILAVKSWVDSEGTTPADGPADGQEILTTISAEPAAAATFTIAGWDEDAIGQGYSRNIGHRHGVMWFPAEAFRGRRIQAAALTLTGGSGSGGAMAVGIATTEIAGMSGNPRSTMVAYGIIGSISAGETKTFALPLEAAQALADGSAAALMLDSGESAAAENSLYSANYGNVQGMNENPPVLTVSYL